jgi:hypothetical protein
MACLGCPFRYRPCPRRNTFEHHREPGGAGSAAGCADFGRESITRGARTATDPAEVVTLRGWWWPRTTFTDTVLAATN